MFNSLLVILLFTILRLLIGLFFVFSGYHKLFNKERHKSITNTLVADGIPLVSVNQWFVPCVEFFGGMAVMAGFLTSLAALGLAIICIMATCVDGVKRIPAWKPIDKADYVDDILYLPEVIYALILALIVVNGAGPLSVDGVFMNIFHYMFGGG